MYILSSPFLMMSFFLCIVGNLLRIRRMRWLGLWLGMEINLFRFLVLTNPEGCSVIQPRIVYFVIQSLGSIILLFGFIANFYQFRNWSRLFIVFGLLMKRGMFPFHSWVSRVVGCARWIVGTIILTWQKLSPFLFFSFFPNSVILVFRLVLICVVGCLGGLSQNRVRIMIVYSSFVHNSWLLEGLITSFSSFIIYFFVYRIGLAMFSIRCWIRRKFIVNRYLISFNGRLGLLVLSGVPPFIGFISKLIIVLVNPNFLLVVCILSSVVRLKFYITFFYRMMIRRRFVKENKLASKRFFIIFVKLNFFFMMICFVIFLR